MNSLVKNKCEKYNPLFHAKYTTNTFLIYMYYKYIFNPLIALLKVVTLYFKVIINVINYMYLLDG